MMLQRPSSRLLVIDSEEQVLLFKFEPKSGPLADQTFWATPGGGVEAGETFEDTACRELFEEVGITIAHPGAQVAQRTATFRQYDGELAEADERYFVVRTAQIDVSSGNWTPLEREVMAQHRWWSQTELVSSAEQVWPEDLAEMLVDIGVWSPMR
jgi:8-oxo-dGTP pyrophosphatase MutT (NUDIX family)